ncbi:8302_t:CDS:1, partial [Cetraspora pellucida]
MTPKTFLDIKIHHVEKFTESESLMKVRRFKVLLKFESFTEGLMHLTKKILKHDG